MKKNKGISKVFLIFLMISLGFWLLTTLSKSYTTTIAIPVIYQKLPQNNLLKEKPVSSIDIVIKATGFKILACKFLSKPIAIQTKPLQKKRADTFYLLPKNQRKEIRKQLPSKLQLVEITQDTIFFKIGILETKKIAVQPDLKISYKLGYELLGNIQLQPDSLLVSGPKSKLNAISSIQLKELEMTDVFENFSKKVTIKKDTLYKNLKFNTKIITVSGKVEQFTEGSFEIPFEIINATSSEKNELRTLIKKVKVIFIVGLTDFENIKKSDFLVVCDYRLSKNNNLNYLIPKLQRKPNQIKSVTILPSKIDFLIKKEI